MNCAPVKIKKQWLGRVSYEKGLTFQNNAVARRLSGEITDTVFLLEHDPVYTIGRTSDHSSLQGESAALPYPVFETNRGGQATYHGPGQLVGYPIIDLRSYGQDLHTYLRSLEVALVNSCNEFGVNSTTRRGLTGVWCGERKIASIGIGVRHWISMHGFAINVCGDLSPFEHITPCGISGIEMTSISREAGRKINIDEFSAAVFTSLCRELAELKETAT
ncbi:MAG: lipoyl(octanoyl) transferase LipB [Verrucomicrobiales bacterium]